MIKNEKDFWWTDIFFILTELGDLLMLELVQFLQRFDHLKPMIIV